MIKSTITEYVDGMKQCLEVRKQAKDYIKNNYLPDSPVGAEAMKQCEATFTETTAPLKKVYSDTIQKHFDDVKASISKVVLNPIPDELMNMLPMLDKMTDTEKQMLLDKYHNNYMASKMLNQGNDSFMTLEHILADIERLQAEVNKVPDMPVGDYRINNLINGTWVDRVNNDIQGFIDKYTVEGGE